MTIHIFCYHHLLHQYEHHIIIIFTILLALEIFAVFRLTNHQENKTYDNKLFSKTCIGKK